MKVLITSGGTKIPIDTVRSITNMSHGTLGSKLAKDALERKDEVIFLCADGSKTPMSFNINFSAENPDECKARFENLHRFTTAYQHMYHEFRYKTFDDYQSLLPQLISLYKPDMIILAAAVSDYAPENIMNGKIRTAGDLNIALKPLPKVISEVRKWAGPKTTIVGFKLLVDVKKDYLIEEACKSLIKNNLDMVCANDLRSLLNGDHQIEIIVKNQTNSNQCTPLDLYDYLSSKVKGKK